MNALWFLCCAFVLQWNNPQVDASNYCATNELHALILARGGSKGIKFKNLEEIDGLSLLARSIGIIKNSTCFRNIWVSTDDPKIALEAEKSGAQVHNRPAMYATDETTSLEAVQEFLEVHKSVDNFALFQCTSVFMQDKYIKQAVEEFKNHDCVFSARRTHELRWKWVGEKILPDNFNVGSRPRRQDWPGDLVEAGMFYFATRKLATDGYLQNEHCAIVEIAPEDGLEIDTERDLNIARCLVKGNN